MPSRARSAVRAQLVTRAAALPVHLPRAPAPDVLRHGDGQLRAPDHEYPSHLELRLTATDAGGLSNTTSVRLDPQTVDLTFGSNPAGLTLAVGSTSQPTPFTRTAILGSTLSISAPSPQASGGTAYEFVSWSDGGAQTHNVVAERPARTSRPTGEPGGPVISQVDARAGPGRVTITWTTDVPADSRSRSVRVGGGRFRAARRRSTARWDITSHSIKISTNRSHHRAVIRPLEP